MHLLKIFLTQFKSYTDQTFEFSEGLNCILGENGSGKTNLLEAIYYLAMTKSAFNFLDQQNIQHGQPFFRIHATVQQKVEKHSISCIVQAGQKKVMQWDGLAYDKMSEHIGKLPVVIIAPQQNELILQGSELRRAFVDGILSQISLTYLENLMQYNHYLRQRNALLKDFYNRRYEDQRLLDVYDQKLVGLSKNIFKIRDGFYKDFEPYFQEYYKLVSQEKEMAGLKYISQVDTHFESTFKAAYPKDLILQRTTVGIHKDDLQFLLGEHPLKRLGSQGQQKSFLIALKLAQYEWMAAKLLQKPILLLDDIFDKLDDYRIDQLLGLIQDKKFGQIFLTDARPERSQKLLEGRISEIKFHNLERIKVKD